MPPKELLPSPAQWHGNADQAGDDGTNDVVHSISRPDETQKDAAERCVRYLMGVSWVTNSIGIKSRATSAGVKGKIEDAFRRNASLDARRIAVETSDGTVTLTGSVSSWSERHAAKSAAWAAPGVTHVKDELVVMP